ncbi:hypothetical protein N7478_007251 [Penicillium angulare]|uniref:uncharacterized protein n=1 Tax=Penicillium angulare TaxID=116970 RepID=UPI002541FF98|nr:uncharacterized protein N7478_007251 [Penicillium angulare]KAJ5281879.1 hypothetical protein N7478_007251 [Penicillium angulare]
MPSARRTRLLAIAVIAILIMTFYYSGEGSSIQNQKFYKSTLEAMKAKENAKQKTKDRIQDAMAKPAIAPAVNADAEKAAPVANVKGTEEMEEIPIAGRTKMTVPKKGPQDTLSEQDSEKAGWVAESEKKKSDDDEKEKEKKEEKEKEEEKLDAKAELNAILKRAPIIIFSKSYCPYSKRAKSILLEGYTISPRPFVVELDQHPIGQDLQTLLAQNTGRRTVPNILVNGKSIGGGDDIAALDQSDDLASKLRQYGGKWVADVTRGPPKDHI